MIDPQSTPLTKAELEQIISDLEARLADLYARLPAHTIPPAMIAELDEIDEQLERARARLARIENQ
jgi:exonuclease VII small subunit